MKQSKSAQCLSVKKGIHKVQSAGHIGGLSPANKIRVIARFRPHNAVEEKSSDDGISDYHQPKTLAIIDNHNIQVESSVCEFDQILDQTTTQTQAFESIAQILCNDVLNGYNSTIFVYGQTGSGKTWTQFGDESHIDTMGIVPRSLSCIFETLKQEKEDGLLIDYSMKASFLEIYNEQLKDLMVDLHSQIGLKVRMNHEMHTYVQGLTWIPVENIHDVLTLIHLANTRRTVSATRMNAASSRGHLLARFSLTKKIRNENSVITQVADAHFADLAGSEKLRKTGATGRRLTEANHINTSLTVLGRVITALTTKKGNIAPFRDSKLTHILKDSLGGNCKTTLVVTGSTHLWNREETINSLKFGMRCKDIRGKMAKVNRIYTKNELLNRVSVLEIENETFRVRASEENEELQQQNNGLQLEIIKLGRMNEKTQIENEELMQRLTFLENQLSATNGNGKGDNLTNEAKQLINFDESKKMVERQMIYSVQNALTASERIREEMKKQMIIFQNEINDLKFANNCQANKVEQAEEAFGIKLEEVRKDKYLCEEIKELVGSMERRHKSVSQAAANVSEEKRKSMEEQAVKLREFAAKRLLVTNENDVKNPKKKLSKTI